MEINERPNQVEKWSLMDNSWTLCKNIAGWVGGLLPEAAAVVDPARQGTS